VLERKRCYAPVLLTGDPPRINIPHALELYTGRRAVTHLSPTQDEIFVGAGTGVAPSVGKVMSLA